MSDTLRNGSWRTPWCATQIWWLSLMKLHEITPLRQSSCGIWQAFAKGLHWIVVNVLPAHKAANTFFETRRPTSILHNVWGCLEGKVPWMLELRFKPFKPGQSLWACELVEKLLWNYEVLNYVEVFLEKCFRHVLRFVFQAAVVGRSLGGRDFGWLWDKTCRGLSSLAAGIFGFTGLGILLLGAP